MNKNEETETPDVEDIDPKEASKRSAKARREAKKAERSTEQSRNALRYKVRMFYDLQRLRLQCAGRTLDRATEIDLHESDIKILGLRADDLARAEKAALRDVESHLNTMPVYTQVLRPIKGIGPAMAGVLVAEVDITRANTASALWRYAGLATVKCYRCADCYDPVEQKNVTWRHVFTRSQKCKHGIVPDDRVRESSRSEYAKKGEKLHYNKFLKTKLVGVLSSCLLRSGSRYRKFYDDYKHRLTTAGKGRTDGHRHQMALRYMIKMLLADVWNDWRELEGLPTRNSYQEQYQGHVHHKAA